MSVVNGAPVEASYTNSKLMSRTSDTSTTGVVALNNTATPASGSSVSNAQQAINETFNAVGMTGVGDTTRNLYSSNEVVVDGDNRKQAIERLDAAFNFSSGHDHSGTGMGAPIAVTDLTGINQFFSEFQSFSLTAASGNSTDISAQMSGKTPGGTSSSLGVITAAPTNRAEIVLSSTGTYIEDAGGQKVYARITESSGVWTLTYFTNEAGTETAHSLTSANISVVYREVFNQETRPTIPSNPLEFGTLDVTADVVDASASVRGVVSTGTQTFGGDKTFNGFIEMAGALYGTSENSSISGSNASLSLPTKSIVRLTNASLVSISAIAAPTKSQVFFLRNVTGSDIDLIDSDSGSTSIVTGTGANFSFKDKSSCILFYDLSSSRWSLIGGGGGSGSGTAYQEVPSGTVDGVNDTFVLTEIPNDSDQIMVFVDGILRPESEWSLIGVSPKSIQFGASHIPQTNQTVNVWYLIGASSTPAPTGTWNVEYRTLSGGEATAKALVLSATPASPIQTLLDIIGGGAQEYSVDFTASGSTIDWNGLGLDGVLSAGDKLRIVYIT